MRFSLVIVASMALLSCIAAVQPNSINLAGNIHDGYWSGPITTLAGAGGSNSKLIAPPTRYATEFVFHVNVGIGTFDTAAGGSSSFKSYNLAIDSGSDLNWIQCEDCKSPGKTCFPQKDPLYPSSQSKSYKPLDCNGVPCVFNKTISAGSYTSGVLATETFTFQSSDGTSLPIPNISFGCSRDSKNIKYVAASRPFLNPTSGVLSLGWGPRSFLSQIDSMSQGKFSYCIKPNNTKKTFLKFGKEVTPPKNPHITPISQVGNLSSYYVNLQGISVGGVRLNFGPSDFALNKDGTGGTVIDSGALFALFKPPVYGALFATLEATLSKNKFLKRVVFHKGFKDLCYVELSPEARKTIPGMTFHLENNADFEVKPEGLFLFAVLPEDTKDIPKGTTALCFAAFPSEFRTAIGALQQIGQKVVYDTKAKQLSFGPEDCDETS
ncbi:hypothetical protein Tsubulata_020297 [Turnera subulata]|uniref:Peptidase A1 domain-containing protein n=1 Tax=Turnera subulata TaxID=218843 RepID=A0A9Q0F0A0_9ROSI|nr:hypothetical protein Tsubulata_020297 [Turnera subulata]